MKPDTKEPSGLLGDNRNGHKEHILRLTDVKKRTGLSRSSIYLSVSSGIFPRPINLGARSVGWLESEIDAWISFRIQQSRNPQSSFASEA